MSLLVKIWKAFKRDLGNANTGYRCWRIEKKAITNVKTRGVLGEIQLERILEQMLTAAQYDKNVQIKRGIQERVEFAVKLPNKNGRGFLYLPIDS